MQNLSTRQQDDTVQFAPLDLVERRFAEWPGLRADIIQARQKAPFDYRYSSNHHLLIAAECSEREHGETMVEGLPKSTRRSISPRLTFVPAGHSLSGWQDPRVLTRVNYFYIDRRWPLLDNESGFAETEFRPRLFFSDPDIWRIAAGLKSEAVNNGARVTRYGEALGVMLGHELVRLNKGRAQPVTRGGLSGWQQKKVAEFIEEHLAEEIRLTSSPVLSN
jgi:AraC family transcriptional regulator